MELKEKKVLVFGSGISGVAASRLLLIKGAEVILYDGNLSLDADEIKKEILDGIQGEVKVILGKLPTEVLNSLDLTIMSPGVPTDLPDVIKMKEKNIPVWGEIELAFVLGKGNVLAITGTNGKTTTTALLGEIMKKYSDSTFVVGNIGNPYTSVVLDTKPDSVVVAEMSSFQLESIHTFRPRVSAILNITPDHLNRHHTMEAYIDAKRNITQNQTSTDFCVLNDADELTRGFGEKVSAEVLYFSSQRKLEKGIYLDQGNIIINIAGKPEKICHVNELKVLGTHNYENVMAAAVMAAAFGVPTEIIRETITAFQGVAHRIEFVAENTGVAYYNDSKGTNPDAAIKGIQAMNRPTFLIGGGYDKDSSYEEWIRAFDGKVKKLVLLGATREKINETAKKLGFTDTVLVDEFEEAVRFCVKHAQPGDAVLLSPACASWGMFQNYEERGDKFKELVLQLSQEK
jgi:UDP-N-acetylmuramoylalanine--D-glutamate ligase